MKKKMLALFLVGIWALPAFAAGEAALFRKYITNLTYVQPQAFICNMTGTAVQKRLQRIPKDAIKNGKRPLAKVYFNKDYGQVIKVEHVDKVFENMFSLYNNYINLTGAYIRNRGRTWKAFTREHEMKIARDGGSFVDVRIKRKSQPRNTYGEFRITRNNMMISQAAFYQQGTLVYRVFNTYTNIKSFLLPVMIRIISYKKNRQKTTDIRFTGYKLNIHIPPEKFRK